jgi:two-component system, OmpR family, response regulator
MAAEPPAATALAALRVLCVDDDRVSALLFGELCRLAGDIDYDSAASAAEALERVTEWAPDLLVIDLHLPDADGCALLPQLRSTLGQRLCPAYLCTADPPELVAARAAAAGFDGCWTKPVTAATLTPVLRQLAAQHRSDPPSLPESPGARRRVDASPAAGSTGSIA